MNVSHQHNIYIIFDNDNYMWYIHMHALACIIITSVDVI